MSGVEYISRMNGVGGKKTLNTHENVEKKRHFKELTRENQLNMLYEYMKKRTKDGLYKKEGNRVIGEYFGVGKDLIGKLIKMLETKKYIIKLSELDRYYKLIKNKEEIQC